MFAFYYYVISCLYEFCHSQCSLSIIMWASIIYEPDIILAKPTNDNDKIADGSPTYDI